MSNDDPKERTIGPVLVAVDFSPSSEAALSWGARAAEAFGAPLVVLHVVHDPEAVAESGADGAPKHLERMEEAAARRLDQFMVDAHSDDSVSSALASARTRLVVGLPATRIVEVAGLEDAQLIVVGSHGRTGLARLLLGSKAQRVAQLAETPVVIVKAEPER